MGQYFRAAVLTSFALCLGFNGCALFTTYPDEFTPLTASQARSALRDIVAATNGCMLIKTKADAVFSYVENGEKKTRSVDILYLWKPGAALRTRIKYLGNPILSVLFDGERWYLTDEINNHVTVCSDIGKIRSSDVPDLFFKQLARLPSGWIHPDVDSYAVARNEYACRVSSAADGIAQELIFPVGSPVPSQARISTDDGTTVKAEFSAPITNMALTAATFAPQLDGYTVKHLD